MEIDNLFNGFYKNKKVLITGHTGFKGSWLTILLHQLGAKVYGYALDPPTNPSLYNSALVKSLVKSTINDIRNFDEFMNVLKIQQPEIIIHMAAQPLVRESYKFPHETYEINVMGTVNLFEAVRKTECVRVVLNVTSDKCYENKEWLWSYRENEPLGGYDPYSNSKACSELVTMAFRNSYFNPTEYKNHGVAVASARAGNVIGGGDWGYDRLIPDFIRSILQDKKVKIRNPYAIRPWQHVLEPLSGYLILCEKLYNHGPKFADAWNFGPDDANAKNVEWIISNLCNLWGNGAVHEIDNKSQPHETGYLKLDNSKAKALLEWYPNWPIEKTLKSIVEWTKKYLNNENIYLVCLEQINEYFST